ncbi:hypothetical protein F9Z43_16270 [Pseudomonas monteilii]|uniref:Uncharacterized protein n=3 Tax=Pseudomonas putida group TaxID=136845 RepID=A0A6G6V2I9_9PSED|nr:hypothetical protein [Pseudomonas monteilii]QIG19942.1 hypothetical protein FY041_20440 [Pseudomonas monteilii]QIG25194.1 hypothetical protein FY043_20435 [Pseudomonas monteilii]
MLNGHLSLLKRNAGLEVASDGGIVRTDPRLSLRPSDNLLQRKTQFWQGFRQCDKHCRNRAVYGREGAG